MADVDSLLYLPGHQMEQLKAALDIPALSPGWRESFRSMVKSEKVARPAGVAVAPPPAWAGFRSLAVAEVVAESASVTSFRFADRRGAAGVPARSVPHPSRAECG